MLHRGVLLLLAACAPYAAGDPVRFPFPSEIPLIREVAKREGVDPALLLAIRASERGKEWTFGVLPTKAYNKNTGYRDAGRFVLYNSELEKQAVWCARTIKANQRRWTSLNWFQKAAHGNDFLRFLGSRYAPVGAKNDKKGLNRNWVRNVRRFYNSFK